MRPFLHLKQVGNRGYNTSIYSRHASPLAAINISLLGIYCGRYNNFKASAVIRLCQAGMTVVFDDAGGFIVYGTLAQFITER